MSRKHNGFNKGKKARGVSSVMSHAKHRSSGASGHMHRWVRESMVRERETSERERRRKRRSLSAMYGTVEEAMRAR